MQTRQPPKFKGPYILCAWIGHPSEMLRPFEFLETFRVQFPAPRYNMRLNWTSELWPFEFLESFRCSVSRVSIYHGLHTYTRVKSYGFLNLQRAFLLGFERLDILCAWIRHPSEMLWPSEFLKSRCCSLFSISIYHGPHAYTQVKSYGRLNLSRLSLFDFERLDILSAWIKHPRKFYDHLNFLRGSVVHLRVSRYTMGLTYTHETKVIAIWSCQELVSSISSVWIYYALESVIWVKCYDHLNFSRAFVVHFLVSWYIMGIIQTPESEVMAVWICRDLSRSISSISIYYVPELNVQMKCYENLSFSRASIVQFRVSRYVIGLTHTPESNIMAVWICRNLLCSILSVSIYYAPESEIRVKSYDRLNFSRASLIHFSNVSKYHGPHTYTRVKGYGCLYF